MTKRKILQLLICFLLGVFIIVPFAQPAQAASYTKINWLTFATKLEDFLWAWRGSQGVCTSRAPLEGSCLSATWIDKIMDQLADPNSDGDLSDMYFKMQDPNARLNYLQNASRNRAYLGDIVYAFEKNQNPPYWIDLPDIDSRQINAYSDSFLGALAVSKGEVKEGDSLIRTLAFYETYNELDQQVFALKAKAQISEFDLEQIYQTARMIPYAANLDYKEWQPDEVAELAKVISVQNKAMAYLRYDPKTFLTSPSKAWDISRALVNSSSFTQAKGSKGGIALLKGNAPSAYTLTVGNQTEILSPSDIMRLFQFSSAPSTAVRYQGIIKKIVAGAQMISKTNQRQSPNLDGYLVNVVKNHVYYASPEYFFNLCGLLAPIAAACFDDKKTKNIYYSDNLNSKNSNPEAVVVHEMFHSIRDNARTAGGFTDQPGNFDEAFTDWMTLTTLNRNNNLYFGDYGYMSREYIKLIQSRLARKNNWTPPQAENYLMKLYFNNSYASLDQPMGKTNFYGTLNEKLSVVQFLKLMAIMAEGTEKIKMLNEVQQRYAEILKYITT